MRVEGIEPSTTCLKGRCSTTELHPHAIKTSPNNNVHRYIVKKKTAPNTAGLLDYRLDRILGFGYEIRLRR